MTTKVIVSKINLVGQPAATATDQSRYAQILYGDVEEPVTGADVSQERLSWFAQTELGMCRKGGK